MSVSPAFWAWHVAGGLPAAPPDGGVPGVVRVSPAFWAWHVAGPARTARTYPTLLIARPIVRVTVNPDKTTLLVESVEN